MTATVLYPEWIQKRIESYTADFSASYEKVHLIDTATSSVDAQLPAAKSGKSVIIKWLGGSNQATITPQVGDNIDGSSGAKTLTSINQSLSLMSDGSDWFII